MTYISVYYIPHSAADRLKPQRLNCRSEKVYIFDFIRVLDTLNIYYVYTLYTYIYIYLYEKGMGRKRRYI